MDNLWGNRCTEEYINELKKTQNRINHSDTSLWLDQLDSLKWWFIRAEKLQHPKDRKSLRMAYQGLANNYRKAQDFYSAFEIYERAHWLLEDPKQLDDYGWYIENPLLTIATRLDNFEKAEYYGWKVVKYLIECQEEEKLSRVYSNLGKLYRTKLDWQQSDSIFLHGIKHSQNIKYGYGEFINTFDLAKNLLLQDSVKAFDMFFYQVENLLPKIKLEKNYELYLVEVNGLKADYYLKSNQYVKAYQIYQESIQNLLKVSNTEVREKSKLYCKLGLAALWAFGPDSANHFYQLGIQLLLPSTENNPELPDIKILYRENTLVELFDLKSQIEYVRFQKSNDIRNLKKAIQSVILIGYLSKSTIEDILGEESKILSLQQLRHYIERTFDWCAEFQKIQNDTELLGYLRDLLDYSKSQLIHDRWNTNARFEELSESERMEVDKTISQIRRWKERINNDDKSASITGLRLKLEKILNQKFYDIFDKDTATNYLEFFVSSRYIFRYSELNGLKNFVVLGAKEQMDKLYHTMNLVISQKDNHNKMVWNELYQFFWSDMPTDGPKKLTIIPDGTLHNLPFEAFVANNQKLLIEQHQISYRFSRIYPKGKGKSRRKIKSNEILILAPQYPENPISSVERGSIYHLKHAQEECEEIHKELDVFPNGSESITKDQLITALKKCRIFHFAGHTVMSSENTNLALEMDQLFYEDIAMMHHHSDLSVLSACETGLGKWIAGDANRSIAKAFTESGTSSVVHSIWTVNDQSTSQIMIDFYRNLKSGQTVGTALANAKLNYLQNASFEWRHPHFWAGFVLTGDSELVLSFGDDHVSWFTLVIGVTLILISALIIVRYKTKIKIN
ncbi:MAG: CHAT domain-containing protein [Saprospiraceae bacterium]|nr:CHAT domain-containing protein [Saprospiraceae bacterium]